MRIWFGDVSIEAALAWRPDSLVEHLGIEITGLGDDWIEGTMPVDRRTHQPYGILHGGASAALAETLGSYGANFAIDRARFRAVGQELSASHVRPVMGGTVTGRAFPLHRDERRHLWKIEIRNPEGRLTCVSHLTMAIVPVRGQDRPDPLDRRGAT